MILNAFIKDYIFYLPLIILITGLLGIVLWKKNLILIIIALELAFIAGNVGFVLTSFYIDDIIGLIFSLFSITLAGAEVSLGLTLAILLFRNTNSVYLNNLNHLKS